MSMQEAQVREAAEAASQKPLDTTVPVSASPLLTADLGEGHLPQQTMVITEGKDVEMTSGDGDEDEDRKVSSTKVGGRAKQSRTLEGALYM